MSAALKQADAQIVWKNEAKWSKPLMAAGWNAIPSIIIGKQQALGLDALDMNIIVHLSNSWWTAETLPFPSVETIARAIGVKSRTVQKRISDSQAAGLLTRIERRNTRYGSDTNLYSFDGLIKAAVPYAQEKVAERAKHAKDEKDRLARKRPKLTVVECVERDRGVAQRIEHPLSTSLDGSHPSVSTGRARVQVPPPCLIFPRGMEAAPRQGAVGLLSWLSRGDKPQSHALNTEHDDMGTETHTKPPMTPTEIALLVKLYREVMGWSQETLAELSGLTVRTIQRVEAAQPSSLDTRRAMARGFQIPDLDAFCTPNPFPTQEEIMQQKAEFDRKYLVIDASVVDGRKIAAMLSDQGGYGAISPASTTELPHAAQEAFADILDFTRDCMDVSDVASRRDMLTYGDQLETMIGELRPTGFCVCMAIRQTSVVSKSWVDQTPWNLQVAYLVAAPLDSPPTKIVVPRQIGQVTF